MQQPPLRVVLSSVSASAPRQEKPRDSLESLSQTETRLIFLHRPLLSPAHVQQTSDVFCLSQYQRRPQGPKPAAFLSRGRNTRPPASYQILGELKWNSELREECCQQACLLPRIGPCASPSVGNTSHVPNLLQRAFKSQASFQCPSWEPLGCIW